MGALPSQLLTLSSLQAVLPAVAGVSSKSSILGAKALHPDVRAAARVLWPVWVSLISY